MVFRKSSYSAWKSGFRLIANFILVQQQQSNKSCRDLATVILLGDVCLGRGCSEELPVCLLALQNLANQQLNSL
jgi:hypothetical protein